MGEINGLKIGGLLLAAGGSKRLGRPKQLVDLKGKTLLRHAAEAIAVSGCSPILVVLGANLENSKAELHGLAVDTQINEDWESGLSSSLRVGLSELLRIAPDIDAVLVTLCDQPFVTANHLKAFHTKFAASKAPIIAARYNDIDGVPALFAKNFFDELLTLKGDKGARQIIAHTSSVTTIDLPEAAFDIDTKADLSKLLTR